MSKLKRIMIAKMTALLALGSTAVFAQFDIKTDCSDVPSYSDLKTALVNVQKQKNGGSGTHIWATIVNRDGVVCAVTFSGAGRGDQGPAGRLISAQKANTANAFSSPNFALSTANLFSGVQNGGSLFGLQFSNPVNTEAAFAPSPENYGLEKDPMVGKAIGGVLAFGGGLALYRSGTRKLVGGLGVAGDSSCTDHIIAWKVRDLLNLDSVPGGVSGGTDNLINDIYNDRSTGTATSPSGFGHPTCDAVATGINTNLPSNFAIGPNPQF